MCHWNSQNDGGQVPGDHGGYILTHFNRVCWFNVNVCALVFE